MKTSALCVIKKLNNNLIIKKKKQLKVFFLSYCLLKYVYTIHNNITK